MSSAANNNNLCQLQSLGCIKLTGPDTSKFLQGQITINAGDIIDKQLSLGAVCNPQGRCIALFWATRIGEETLLIQLRETIESTITHLKKYAVFFKTEIVDSSSEFTFFADLIASQANDSVEPSQIAIPDIHALISQDQAISLIAVRDTVLDDFLTENQVTEQDARWFYQLAEKRIPWLTGDTQSAFLPHNLDLPQLSAVSFKKGCFTGQEVIARMQYKGKLKSHMQLMTLQAQSANESFASFSKAKILAGEESVGEIICCAQADEKTLILALLKDNSLENEFFALHEPNGPILNLIRKP